VEASLDPCNGVYQTWVLNVDGVSSGSGYWPSDPATQALALQSARSTNTPYPLGYQQFFLKYGSAVCIEVVNSQNRVVEIRLEPVLINSPAEFCVRDQGNDVTNSPTLSLCGAGKQDFCYNAPVTDANSNFYIYCDRDCNTDGTAFYIRFRVSAQTWADPIPASSTLGSAWGSLDMWCMAQGQRPEFAISNLFPSQIQLEVVQEDVVIGQPLALPSSAFHHFTFFSTGAAVLSSALLLVANFF